MVCSHNFLNDSFDCGYICATIIPDLLFWYENLSGGKKEEWFELNRVKIKTTPASPICWQTLLTWTHNMKKLAYKSKGSPILRAWSYSRPIEVVILLRHLYSFLTSNYYPKYLSKCLRNGVSKASTGPQSLTQIPTQTILYPLLVSIIYVFCGWDEIFPGN
jgi:hypothetical protein